MRFVLLAAMVLGCIICAMSYAKRTGFFNNMTIEEMLHDVRLGMLDCLRATSLQDMADELGPVLSAGKMLRAGMAVRIGSANCLPARTLVRIGVAVEVVHAASLLHDDVIDGAWLRRGAPSLWTVKGVTGAILLGDLLAYRALEMIGSEKESLLPHLVRAIGQMCDAEAGQALVAADDRSDWQKSVVIAERKTGALFGFVGYACGGDDVELREALHRAAIAAGTAYQVADDVLDAYGDARSSGKTLGTDALSGKLTAVSASDDCLDRSVRFVARSCEEAQAGLRKWPRIHEAWRAYMDKDMGPAISKSLDCLPVQARA